MAALDPIWEKSMLKKILAYGVLAGLIVGIPLSCITISVDFIFSSPRRSIEVTFINVS